MAATYDILISYDISEAHHKDQVNIDVKNCMLKKGYADRFTYTSGTGTKKIIHLPNTTLWKKNTSTDEARNDLNSCITEYNNTNNTKHTAENVIALEFTSTFGASSTKSHTANSTAPDKNN